MNKLLSKEAFSFINELAKTNDNLIKLKQECEINNIPLITPEVESFLTLYLKDLKPKKILEIGTGYAYSTLFFAMFDSVEKIISIEKYEKSYNIATQNIVKYKMDNKIQVKHIDALDFLKNHDEKYDFIFIDAAKSKYKEFFDYCTNLLNKNGVIACDNALIHFSYKREVKSRRYNTIDRKLNEFLKYISELENFDTSILTISDGLTLSKLK